MISEHELLEEIEKCKLDPVTFRCIEKMASLYTVYDHLYGNPEPNYNGRIAERIYTSGDTEFLKTVNRADTDKVWSIMDELMSVLKISHPRLYESVMLKLDE